MEIVRVWSIVSTGKYLTGWNSMTVKELIKQLLDAPMDAKVEVKDIIDGEVIHYDIEFIDFDFPGPGSLCTIKIGNIVMA